MKKNLLFAASILAIGGFLAACGSEETTDENTGSSPDEAMEEVVDNETDEDTPAEEVTEDTEAVEEPEEDASSEDTEAPSEPADGTENTEEAEEPAEQPEMDGTVMQSPEQAYEITVMPAYELTSEEPGKDSLYLSADSSVFMRVETFSPGDIDFAYAEDIMKQTVQAANSEAELTEGTALDGEEFINSSVYEIPSEEGKVTGVVFEKEGVIVRLTIFDKTAIDATPDFIKMGQTIESSN